MDEIALTYMETFFMALADKTRLRLLNLMRDREICVCFFTDVLGESQPKVSRHLAYLRNAGLVDTRRDGKWIHYSIAWPDDPRERTVLEKVFEWLGSRKDMTADRELYSRICGPANAPIRIERRSVSVRPASEIEPAAAYQAHNELEEFLL